MTIDKIKELIQVLQETGIGELEVQNGDQRVRIRRAVPAPQEMVVPTVLPMAVTPPLNSVGAPAVPPLVAAAPPAADPAPAATEPPAENGNDLAVKSPIVGTYYDAPAPGSPPFVKVGDRVEPKQVLCIIESMKLMNEIEAEVAGTLIAKLVENGRPVEYGEALFTIRPFTAA